MEEKFSADYVQDKAKTQTVHMNNYSLFILQISLCNYLAYCVLQHCSELSFEQEHIVSCDVH